MFVAYYFIVKEGLFKHRWKWAWKEAGKIKPPSKLINYINPTLYSFATIAFFAFNSPGGIAGAFAATAACAYISKKESNTNHRHKKAWKICDGIVEKSILTLAKDKIDFKVELQIKGIDNTIYATGDIAIAKHKEAKNGKFEINGTSNNGKITPEEYEAFCDAFPEMKSNLANIDLNALNKEFTPKTDHNEILSSPQSHSSNFLNHNRGYKSPLY